MGVVINEFEVLSDPGPVARQAADGAAAGEAQPPEPLEPQDVLLALRQLELQALRLWAH